MSESRTVVTVAEALEYLDRQGFSIPERTLRYHIAKGALEVVKVESAVRIRVDSLRAYVGLPRQSRQQAS